MYRKKDTLLEYKKAIKDKFKVEQKGIYASFLLNPSRAKLRDFCIERFRNNSSLDDLTSFKLFAGFEFEQYTKQKMSNLTDKFRPIEDFFLNNSDLADMKSVEIAAILVNYHPRPFLKYVKSNSEIEKEEDIEFDNISEKKLIINEQIEKDTSFNFSVKKKVAVGLLSVLGLFSVGYTSKELVFPTKECMQWQVDHYEEVDCDVKGIASYNDVIPIEGHQLKLKKIDVDSMTVFFKGEKPVVFYCKVNGKPEFFNQFGIHPETGQVLKETTPYIIDKYVKNNYQKPLK